MLKEKAKKYATKAHEGQTRKTTGLPMIGHPIRVADTLEKAGFPEEVVAAGFLHDTVEDTEVTISDIIREFGEEVARIVMGNTEDKDKSWEKRKEHTIEAIKTAPLEIKALVVADKLDNLKALAEDHALNGERVWDNFKRGRDLQKWYFTGVAANMTFGLEPNDIPAFFQTYRELVTEFFT